MRSPSGQPPSRWISSRALFPPAVALQQFRLPASRPRGREDDGHELRGCDQDPRLRPDRDAAAQSFRRALKENRAKGEVTYHVIPPGEPVPSVMHSDGRTVPLQYGGENNENFEGFGGWALAAVDYARLLTEIRECQQQVAGELRPRTCAVWSRRGRCPASPASRSTGTAPGFPAPRATQTAGRTE